MRNLVDYRKSFCFRAVSKLLVAAIAVTYVFIFNAGNVQAAGNIADIDKSADYARTSIEALAESQVISGDENGNFHPANTVKRSEMIKMIVKALGADMSVLPESPTFADVPKDNWAFSYIETAYRMGIVKGISNTMFGADRECTREEMAAMFVRAAGLTEEKLKNQQQGLFIGKMKDNGSISSWAKEYVDFALSSGLMKGIGSGSFGPGNSAQRQQVAVVTNRFITERTDINRLADTFNGNIAYPELLNALQNNSSDYKGNLDMNMQIAMNDNAKTFSVDIGMLAGGKVDTASKKMDVSYTMSMGITGMPLSEQKFRVIAIGNDYYVKYDGDETWTKTDASTLNIQEPAEGNQNSKLFANYFRYANVTKEENVEFDGAPATKYTLSYGKEATSALMYDILNSQMQDQQSQVSINTEEEPAEIVIYLNNKNQVLNEQMKFGGSMWDEESKENVNMEISLNVHYYNIGQDVEIKAPEM